MTVQRTPRAVTTPQRLALAACVVLLLAGLWWLLRPGDPAISRIQESGVWRVGMDPSFPPFENLDVATGQPAGFDVDLARAIAARWGVRVEFSGVGFDQLLDAVAAQRIDSAISAHPYVNYRTEEVAFSNPYYDAGLVLAVAHGSGVRAVADLPGLRVATEWGSEGDAEARALQARFEGKLSLVLKETTEDALAATARGEADAAIVDAVGLALYRAQGGPLAAVGGPLRSNPYVIVVPRNSPQLLARINRTLSELAADGTLARLEVTWLGAP